MDEQKYKTPSDLAQMPIVWRYELLRYLRSWRLAASIAVVVLVLALFFFLPPALGHPYSGTDTQRQLTVHSIPTQISSILPFKSYAGLPRPGSTISNLVIYANGTELPQAAWVLEPISSIPGVPLQGTSGNYVIMFVQDLTTNNVTATFGWRISAESFDSLNLQFANFLIVICATFFGADSIVGEFWNRTGYLVFPNPIKRSVMFFGKYTASMTAGAIVISLLYAGVTGLSLITAHGLDDKLWLSYLFAIEYLGAAIAIGYFVSSVLKGTTGAIILTFFALLLILPIIDGIAMFTSTSIPESLTFSAGVITFILQSPYPTSTTQSLDGLTLTTYYPDPATSAIVMFGWALVAILVSLYLFNKKQLLG